MTGQLLSDLADFRERCEEAEYTDTGDAWAMIDRLEDALRQIEVSTLPDALAFIASADETDLQRVTDSVRMRRKTLATLTAAAVQVGMDVVTSGLSPKYLNDLGGTVTSINGQRGDVTLDEPSTNVLRYSGKRFFVGPDVKNYVLQGVPLQCCKPTKA